MCAVIFLFKTISLFVAYLLAGMPYLLLLLRLNLCTDQYASSTPFASDNMGEELGHSPPDANILLSGQEQECWLSFRSRRYSLSRGNRMNPLALGWSLCRGWFLASSFYSALWLLMLLIFASLFHHRFHHWYLFPYQNSHVAQITGLVVPVCRRAASFHSTTNTTILQKPPYSTGSAHGRPPASSSPISIQHRKPSSFSSPINSHRKPSSSSSPICSQPKIPPASRSPINSQHRKATVSSSPGRSTTPAEVTNFYLLGEKKFLFVRFLDLMRHNMCK